jgi:hypothetical protein
MTPQAMLKARFSELADSLGVTVSARRQDGKFYFTVFGLAANIKQFMQASFPGAWMTSGAMSPEGGELVYGLPLKEVERVLAEVQVEPAWLQHNDRTPLRIAQGIRAQAAYDRLPILADALEEAGCTHVEILNHCRADTPHKQTCWVVELLLGPSRKRRNNIRPAPMPFSLFQ